MKAKMDSGGTITLTPETELECYALKKWEEESKKEHNCGSVNHLNHWDVDSINVEYHIEEGGD